MIGLIKMTTPMRLMRVAVSIAMCLTLADTQDFDEKTKQCLNCIAFASTSWMKGPSCNTWCGPFQISKEYWLDGGSPGGTTDFRQCAADLKCAETAVISYMNKYGTDCDGDREVTCLDYARIHKNGPSNCGSPDVTKTPYWEGFIKCMKGQAQALDARIQQRGGRIPNEHFGRFYRFLV